MKTVHYFILLLTLNSLVSNAQHKATIIPVDDDPTPIYYKWLGTMSRTLTKMKLVYEKPDGFKEVSEIECFDAYKNLGRTFTCLPNQLRSKDKQQNILLILIQVI